MKTWLKRLAAGAGILGVAVVLLVLFGSLVARQVAVFRAERDFPPPGRLVEIDGRSSHIHCTGDGVPTIVLESGLDDRGSWSWATVQDELSRISRVCAYDRAGMLWSEPRAGPRHAERIADELHALLGAASETPPYVMGRVMLELHGELAALSTTSDHRIVERAGHYIHRDRPDAVVAAVRDVVTAVREGGEVRGDR